MADMTHAMGEVIIRLHNERCPGPWIDLGGHTQACQECPLQLWRKGSGYDLESSLESALGLWAEALAVLDFRVTETEARHLLPSKVVEWIREHRPNWLEAPWDFEPFEVRLGAEFNLEVDGQTVYCRVAGITPRDPADITPVPCALRVRKEGDLDSLQCACGYSTWAKEGIVTCDRSGKVLATFWGKSVK